MFQINSKNIPTKPGCYIMKDGVAEVIYVGKAKNLQKRVSSYWRSKDPKTMALVSEIDDIEFITTNNEVEALILEFQLIKKYHPKYNIDLKSGNRYAFLKITDERFPRLISVRKITKDGKYFGPYPSGSAREAMMRAGIKIFKLRTCKKLPAKVCLRYYLGLCSAPCQKFISETEYSDSIKLVEKFLKGDYEVVREEFESIMKQAAAKQEFEKAKIYRDQLIALNKLERQKVSLPKRADQQVINYIETFQDFIIQIFNFKQGIISGRKEFLFSKKKYNFTNSSHFLEEFIKQYFTTNDVPHELIVPEIFPDKEVIEVYLEKIAGRKVEIIKPERGDRLKLLKMVEQNLRQKVGDKESQLLELQKRLFLKKIPENIVCIDISTLSGTESVGSLVRFVNGQPDKSGYRKFKIKTVTGVNDYAMVKEVLARYLVRVVKGLECSPDLIMIDGGKGQLNVAIETLNEVAATYDFLIQIPIISLAKRLEEIFLPGAPIALRLHPTSQALQLLRAIRDEAHRFAITFQRKRRKLTKQ